MKQLGRYIGEAAAAGVVFATVQAVWQTLALSWVYRNLLLPPHDFFPTQVYDCFTKLAHAVAPGVVRYVLPDYFVAASWDTRLLLLSGLVFLALSSSLVLAPLVGICGRLVFREEAPGVRRFVALWVGLAVCVHLGVWLLGFQAAASEGWSHIVRRHLAHPLLLDWALFGYAGAVAETTARYLLLPFFLDGVFVALVACLAAGVSSAALIGLGERRSLGVRRVAWGIGAVGVLATISGMPLAAMWTPSGRPSAPHPEPPAPGGGHHWNVLLISIDSLRADHVGCYGYRRNTSPAIDALARKGVRFQNAVSPTSWTLPAHLSLFTGRYQLSHTVVDQNRRLPDAIPTLGEILHAAGYVTGGIVSAPFVAAHYGFGRGMDSYEDLSAHYKHPAESYRRITSPEVSEKAVAWLETHQAQRFFLFLHYFDVHYDYIPPPPYDTMFDPDYHGTIDGRSYIANRRINSRMPRRDLDHVRALYDGEIAFTDLHVGAVVRALTRLGLDGRTLIVLLADHGDEFFEHGHKGHYRTLYDEVLRVPLVFVLPDGTDAGRSIHEQVSLVDVMPTILALLGLPSPPGVDGRSLAGALRGERLAPEPIYGAFFNKPGLNIQSMIRGDTFKLIQHFNRMTDPFRPAVELYDLASDPRERRNLFGGKDTAQARTAQHDLQRWLDQQWHHPSARPQAAHIDDATREQLRSLGYFPE